MNTLGYSLLSMLVRKPCSGYELKQILEGFWRVKHSQIYPQLSKLEKDGLLSYELLEQNGNKPDKKIYSITEKGLEVLKTWIADPAAPPFQRDEFLTKVYAIWLTDAQTATNMFEDRIKLFEEKVIYRREEIQKMEDEFGPSIMKHSSKHFGRYILYNQILRHNLEEIEWCNWVINLLKEDTDE